MRASYLTFLIAGLCFLAFSCQSSTSSDDILIKPREGKFQVTVNSTGELQAKRSTRIYGPRGGRSAGIYQMKIQSIEQEGKLVEKGDFIAELDKSEIAAKITEAKLSLQKAQSQYDQAVLDTALTMSEARDNIANLKYAVQEKEFEMKQSVYEAPAVQRQLELEYEKSERAYEQAISNYQKRIAQSVAQVKEKESDLFQERNEYNQLMELLKEFTIFAPEPGMLIYFREWNGRKRIAGSMLSPWDPIVATLPDLSEMESITYVNEVDIQKVRKGQTVSIGLDAVANKYLTGVIEAVANIGEQRPNSESKVFEVKISVSQQDTTLRPAMTTSNEILVAEKTQALYVPLECLHVRDSVNFVFKQTGGGIIRQEVETGLMNENEVELLAGINLEDDLFLSLPGDTVGLTLIPLSEPSEPIVEGIR
ncbi:MAG: HlyD family efflux transporter periplasmic adaptor subunit [Bacteroidota bacterium]